MIVALHPVNVSVSNRTDKNNWIQVCTNTQKDTADKDRKADILDNVTETNIFGM